MALVPFGPIIYNISENIKAKSNLAGNLIRNPIDQNEIKIGLKVQNFGCWALYFGRNSKRHTKSVGILHKDNCMNSKKNIIKIGQKLNVSYIKTENIMFHHRVCGGFTIWKKDINVVDDNEINIPTKFDSN